MAVTREKILEALVEELQTLPWALGLIEGGAAAWGRIDDWSDIDLGLLVDEATSAEVFDAVETILTRLSPIDLRYEMPQPTLGGQDQVFFRLRDAGPFLLIDLSLMKPSADGIRIPQEIHGRTRVHFDKTGQISVAPLEDDERRELRNDLEARLPALKKRFELFQGLVLKELHRGNWIEAYSFYMGFTLRPLLEVLSLRHRPAHASFATRYIYYELPAELHARLEGLWFVPGPADLAGRHEQACALFRACLAELEATGIRLPDPVDPPA